MTSVKILSSSNGIQNSQQQQYHDQDHSSSSTSRRCAAYSSYGPDKSNPKLVAPIPQKRSCRNFNRTSNQTLSDKESKARNEIMSIISHSNKSNESWRNVVGRYSPDHSTHLRPLARSFTPPLRMHNPLIFDNKFTSFSNEEEEEEETSVGAEIGILSLSPNPEM
eukprot:gb/GECH01011456.1/.p1 GENE.gb/GECH01011456.1/~~gb/GECH01011456.1/.p1  ORF type:complete len:165 (+),score=27.22 gb/GECH01011456.1/:1-495(+)